MRSSINDNPHSGEETTMDRPVDELTDESTEAEDIEVEDVASENLDDYVLLITMEYV
jgi:hypothetical protein